MVLLTVHRAKGLEWDTVFVPALNKGVFPVTGGTLDDPDVLARCVPYELRLEAPVAPDLEGEDRRNALRRVRDRQEWRTAYVAVTRARHRLIITGSHRTPERKRPRSPSPLFVMATELADSTVTSDDPGVIELPPWKPLGAAPDPLFTESGWDQALRRATDDPGWLASYPPPARCGSISSRCPSQRRTNIRMSKQRR